MPKVTQKYRLWTLLSQGNVVSPAEIAKALGIKEKAVPVYVHKLKKRFKAEIEITKEGKSVTGYKLVNKIKVPEYRRNNAQYDGPKKKDAAKKTTTASALDTESATSPVMGEKELADVGVSIGLDVSRGALAD